MKTTLTLISGCFLAIILGGFFIKPALAASGVYCHNQSLGGQYPILIGLLSPDSTDVGTAGARALPLIPIGINTLPPMTAEKLTADFQEAATAVQKYQEAWEKLFRQKISSHLLCSEHGRCLRDMFSLAKLVQENLTLTDFTDTSLFLDEALLALAARDHTVIKERLETLFLHHQHAALQFQVWNKLNLPIADADQMRHGIAAARQLQKFRQSFHLELSPWLHQLQTWERQQGDLAGATWQKLFLDADPLRKLPALAILRVDQMGLAKKEEWQNQPLDIWKKNARPTPFIIDQQWSPQIATADKGKPLWLMLNDPAGEKSRNGQRQLYLNFRGLPGRCVIYQNGRELGCKQEVLPESFRVPIDKVEEGAETKIVIQLLDGVVTQPKNWALWLSTEKKE